MQINSENYEEYFLLYTDGELDPAARLQVEQFVKKYPEFGEEFSMLAGAVLHHDESVVFENKETLYRKEKKRGGIFLNVDFANAWFGNAKKIAAAAILLLFLGVAGWVYRNKNAGIIPAKPGSAGIVARKQAPPVHTMIPKTFSEPVIAQTGLKLNKRKISLKRNPLKNRVPENSLEDVQPADDMVFENIPHTTVAVVQQDGGDAGVFKGKINIPVRERIIAPAGSEATNENIQYAREQSLSGNDKIYVANTSFSGKNNLRMVFRKASRIIEKVTTFQ